MADIEFLKAEGLRAVDEMAKLAPVAHLGWGPLLDAYKQKVTEHFVALRAHAVSSLEPADRRARAAEAADAILTKVSQGPRAASL